MVDLACTQADAGHIVAVCSAGGDFNVLLTNHGVRHYEISHERKSPALFLDAYRVSTLIRNFDPEIVHAHMMTSSLVARVLQPMHNYKLVTTVHNEFQRSAILQGVGQRVIGVSEAVTRSMIKRGIPSSVMRTVLNGTIGSPRFVSDEHPLPTLCRPAILFVGGLHARKGVDDLIKAFATVSRDFATAKLYLVGSGPDLSAYMSLAKSLAPGRIEFVGHRDDVLSFMRAADVFVLPSRAEPAGLVLSEAREAGCAIIAADVGGISEMLENGAAGILVPPDRPDVIARNLRELLAEPVLLSSLRQRSQIKIDRMKIERVARETEAVYREILEDTFAHRKGGEFHLYLRRWLLEVLTHQPPAKPPFKSKVT